MALSNLRQNTEEQFELISTSKSCRSTTPAGSGECRRQRWSLRWGEPHLYAKQVEEWVHGGRGAGVQRSTNLPYAC